MTKKDFDFSGWATKNDLKCSDGRTIRKDAFNECNGHVVPLVWNHLHNDPTNVLGHALLENREEGVYTYGKFNDTPAGRNAKELVQHGDVTALSIYANQLKQNGGDVLHGVIREVSLVLAGANPGASIDAVLEHGEYGDEYCEDEAIIYTNEIISCKEAAIEHADSEKKEEEQKVDKPEEKKEEKEETVQDVIDSMNEKQKQVMYAMIGAALDDKNQKPEEGENKGEDMKHNVFDNDDNKTALKHSLTLDEQKAIIAEGKKYGSLKESVLAHAEEFGGKDVAYLQHAEDEYGIEYSTGDQDYFVNDPSFLFPQAKSLNNPPSWIKRRTGWVSVVMNGISHTPFSRIKSQFADITADEARAKGYTKGKRKLEEVFTLLKRTTTPQTVYKKQKMDRDDVLDITDFDVVAWIKSEMRVMLDEELARAILIGDGRSTSSDDKIDPTHIRPVWTDADLFTIKQEVAVGADADATAKNFIKAAVRGRKNYQGSGNPVLFTTEELLTDMLLLEDQIGHRLYKTEQELATAMRVSRIVTVQVMENQTRTDDDGTHTLKGLILNLSDYTVGADKGGAVSMFDDFDIDYNQQKYLIETRCSGALKVPYSAIALETVEAGNGEG